MWGTVNVSKSCLLHLSMEEFKKTHENLMPWVEDCADSDINAQRGFRCIKKSVITELLGICILLP